MNKTIENNKIIWVIGTFVASATVAYMGMKSKKHTNDKMKKVEYQNEKKNENTLFNEKYDLKDVDTNNLQKDEPEFAINKDENNSDTFYLDKLIQEIKGTIERGDCLYCGAKDAMIYVGNVCFICTQCQKSVHENTFYSTRLGIPFVSEETILKE